MWHDTHLVCQCWRTQDFPTSGLILQVLHRTTHCLCKLAFLLSNLNQLVEFSDSSRQSARLGAARMWWQLWGLVAQAVCETIPLGSRGFLPLPQTFSPTSFQLQEAYLNYRCRKSLEERKATLYKSFVAALQKWTQDFLNVTEQV